MIECIVNYLCDNFAVKRDVAFIFYIEVLDRYKLEHLIQHLTDLVMSLQKVIKPEAKLQDKCFLMQISQMLTSQKQKEI